MKHENANDSELNPIVGFWHKVPSVIRLAFELVWIVVKTVSTIFYKGVFVALEADNAASKKLCREKNDLDKYGALYEQYEKEHNENDHW